MGSEGASCTPLTSHGGAALTQNREIRSPTKEGQPRQERRPSAPVTGSAALPHEAPAAPAPPALRVLPATGALACPSDSATWMKQFLKTKHK